MEETPMDSSINRQRTDTPQDERIRGELDRALTTEWSRSVINDLRQELTQFFTFSLDNLQDTEAVVARHAELVPKLAEISKSHIASGEQNLEKVRGDKGIMILTLSIKALSRLPLKPVYQSFRCVNILTQKKVLNSIY